MSADPTHANSSYCGPEPFSRQSWQLNSTLNVLDTSLSGGVAPTIIPQHSRRANSYYDPPGDSCTKCCCCIIANPDTRNFCASNSGGGWQAIVPNCDYMQLNPDIVESNLGADGKFMDSYTIQGTLLIWLIMDPAYGCFQDVETVTLAQSTPTKSTPTQSTPTQGTTQSIPTSATSTTNPGSKGSSLLKTILPAVLTPVTAVLGWIFRKPIAKAAINIFQTINIFCCQTIHIYV
jgi:hypothetical protein